MGSDAYAHLWLGVKLTRQELAVKTIRTCSRQCAEYSATASPYCPECGGRISTREVSHLRDDIAAFLEGEDEDTGITMFATKQNSCCEDESDAIGICLGSADDDNCGQITLKELAEGIAAFHQRVAPLALINPPMLYVVTWWSI